MSPEVAAWPLSVLATPATGSVSAQVPAINTKARPSRKQEILDVFARQVAVRGYDSVSIRDVAEELGMSKGTVIHHYSSKDRMLEQVHSQYMVKRLQEAYLILERLTEPAEQLAGMILQNLLAMQLDYDATVAFAREIVRFASEDIMEDVRKMRREYFQLMHDILLRGMQDGVFRREDPTIVSLQIFGMVNWSWTWMRRDGSWRAEELGGVFLRNVISGISADSPVSDVVTQRVLETVLGAIADRGAVP
jgi:TetR/AcrR family transcriptional regulator, cholesterol catabolism regulator